jgi:hypothetical protein
MPPEEVLYRRLHAPDRWADHDVYMAHERELLNGGDGVLPSSDLLTAIHFFSSHFYDALGRRHSAHSENGWNFNYRSLDETALLSLGILLEEAARETLGEKGHLAFAEGEALEETPQKTASTPPLPAHGDPGPARKKRKITMQESSS